MEECSPEIEVLFSACGQEPGGCPVHQEACGCREGDLSAGDGERGAEAFQALPEDEGGRPQEKESIGHGGKDGPPLQAVGEASPGGQGMETHGQEGEGQAPHVPQVVPGVRLQPGGVPKDARPEFPRRVGDIQQDGKQKHSRPRRGGGVPMPGKEGRRMMMVVVFLAHGFSPFPSAQCSRHSSKTCRMWLSAKK